VTDLDCAQLCPARSRDPVDVPDFPDTSSLWRREELPDTRPGANVPGLNDESRSQRREAERMKIRPLQDRILVQRIEEEEKTRGGIIIPDSAKEKPQEGRVIAVGKGKILDNGQIAPLEVAEGDRVLFAKYGGTEVKLDGEEYVILREDDVLAINKTK
jgi:chaperonin GroES